MAAEGQDVAIIGGTTPGAAGQALALVHRGREVWVAMPPKRRSRLTMAAVVLASICALLAWWSGRTNWKVLYSGLEGRDLQMVQAELAAANISYEPTPDGLGVQVPAELLDKARVEVAAKGMPQSGRMGFELFDKPNWVGSEFDEKVNYQRALEGELEHTIATIGSVRSARVHLVLPKESLFTSERMQAKASVVLKLKRTALGRAEVESIRNLVSGAVEGLTPDQVVLVDADGKANFSPEGQATRSAEAEQLLEQKVIAMLEPLAGRDNIRAQVNVLYDQGSMERTDEVVDPTQVTALSTERRDQTAGAGGSTAMGIPGTASNTAAAVPAGTAAATPPVFPTAGSQGQMNHEETSTFAVTRHTTHEEHGPGRVLRVTVAVVVNDRELTEGTGAAAHRAWHARSAEEMKRLEELAQAAVGFDAKRGDQVVLQNVGFQANQPEVLPTGLAKISDQAKGLLQSQPELLKTLGVVLVTVLLILMVVRPVTQQALVMLKEPASLGAGSRVRASLAAESADGAAAGDKGLPMAEPSPLEMLRKMARKSASIDEEGVREYVAAHVNREPDESSRLLVSWIDAKERG